MAECDYEQKMGEKTMVPSEVPREVLSWLTIELGFLNLKSLISLK